MVGCRHRWSCLPQGLIRQQTLLRLQSCCHIHLHGHPLEKESAVLFFHFAISLLFSFLFWYPDLCFDGTPDILRQKKYILYWGSKDYPKLCMSVPSRMTNSRLGSKHILSSYLDALFWLNIIMTSTHMLWFCSYLCIWHNFYLKRVKCRPLSQSKSVYMYKLSGRLQWSVTPSWYPLPHGIFTCTYLGHLAAVSEEQL